MTSSDFDSLIRSYGKWLSDNTTYTQLDEWYEVNVPLLDEDNDYTQFYVKPGKNSVTFSDDCATLRRLESHGMTVTESRLAVLKDILNQFGIERNGDELTLTSDTADFADAKKQAERFCTSITRPSQRLISSTLFHGRIRRRHERHQVNWLFSSMIRIGALTIS